MCVQIKSCSKLKKSRQNICGIPACRNSTWCLPTILLQYDGRIYTFNAYMQKAWSRKLIIKITRISMMFFRLSGLHTEVMRYGNSHTQAFPRVKVPINPNRLKRYTIMTQNVFLCARNSECFVKIFMWVFLVACDCFCMWEWNVYLRKFAPQKRQTVLYRNRTLWLVAHVALW